MNTCNEKKLKDEVDDLKRDVAVIKFNYVNRVDIYALENRVIRYMFIAMVVTQLIVIAI